jgi:hypothetical protein
MSKLTEGKVMLQMVLSDGTQVTLRTSQQMTTVTMEELLAYLAVYAWVLRRRSAREVSNELASSALSWWRNALGEQRT